MTFRILANYLEQENKMLLRIDLKNLKYFLKWRGERC